MILNIKASSGFPSFIAPLEACLTKATPARLRHIAAKGVRRASRQRVHAFEPSVSYAGLLVTRFDGGFLVTLNMQSLIAQFRASFDSPDF